MADSTAGSYANALAKVVNFNGTLEATSVDIEKVEKFFSDPKVVYFFSNPTVDIAKKRELHGIDRATPCLQF
ncbi:unnamed protein product [Ilex paraguariensis]|uniref:Uncharacterized protein n=1 Tax=Ilex paraguariensis TaxID=185542 RepID=A0ABC8RG60_9AQUA